MQTSEILNSFEELGFVVIEDVLDPQRDLQPIFDDYASLLDELAKQWYTAAKLTSSYSECAFEARFVQIISELDEAWTPYFDISPSFSQENAPMHLSEAIFHLLRNPSLLDVVEVFIGSEIYSIPIRHVRIKPPERLLLPQHQWNGLTASTPWHQDQGVVLPEADESTMLTVWLPVMDATVDNGCLCVIPGSHRSGLVTHCPGKELAIPEKLRGDKVVPVPVKQGSVLFMHRRTLHASLPNLSDSIRWSFDLRYQPIGEPSGRPAFPGFVARSRQNPQSELIDYHVWAALWQETRARLAQQGKPSFHRWAGDEPDCA